MLLALFFGMLISISHLILIFSIIIVFYNLCDVWGGWQVSKTIRPLIDRKLAMDDCIEEKEIIKTLKLYYFGNPTLQRVITIMFCNWIAVCMSLIFYFDHNPLFRNIAYSLIILNIIISEIVIYLWRKKRDKIIDRFEKTLSEEEFQN